MLLFSRHKKFFVFLSLFCLLFSADAACASDDEKKIAADIGKLIVEQFHPETVDLTVSSGGSFVYAEAAGCVIENMRVEQIAIEALLKDVPQEISIEKKYDLSDRIYFSKGKIILLEKDVNNYFVHHFDDIKGFTQLKCDFSPSGFTASGNYHAKFILNFNFRLKATGIVKLRKDGIYIENAAFYINGAMQPDYLAGKILEQINPLLDFKEDIPFPITLKTFTMTDTSAVANGYPKRSFSGESWSYRK